MNLQETFDNLRKAGIQALPVPGTNKYFISFQDGQSTYVREKIILRLAQSAVKDPQLLLRTLKDSQKSRVPG